MIISGNGIEKGFLSEIWNPGKGQVRRMQISSPEKVVGSYSASAVI